MSEKTPLSERVIAFRQHLQETAPQREPAQLTDEQKKELGETATQLLTKLVSTAHPFLHLEELQMKDKQGLASLYLTPFVRLSEEESADPFAVFVDSFHDVSFGSNNPSGGDLFGPTTVKATIMLQVPERESPIGIIDLEGIITEDSPLQCTKVATTDDFFHTREDEANGQTFNQLDAVRKSIEIADSIGEILQGVDFGISVNGKKGHVLIAEDWKRGKQTLFIPHSKP